eukprot:gene7262-9900_t
MSEVKKKKSKTAGDNADGKKSKSKEKKSSDKVDKSPNKTNKDKSKSSDNLKVSEPTNDISSDGNIKANAIESEIGRIPLVSKDPALVAFEAGQIFSKFDNDGDGKLDKYEFTELLRQNPSLLSNDKKQNQIDYATPNELISNRLLTHFDETAGIAIPRSDVEHHRNMGNIVSTLVDSYRARYDRLRLLLTGKLLPKREHLLQLHRQLQNTSVEVDAKRRVIERETLVDTEQILERLKTVESMRQSSIKHQIIQLEEELQTIERIVRRVEQANFVESLQQNTTGVLLTSAFPGASPVETIRNPRAHTMVELIHQFGDLSSSIERLASKPITVQVDFPTDDFPRETAERLEVISRCDKYVHALNVKDHMLWVTLQEKEKAEDLLSEERKLSYEYAQEVANWAEMTNQLNQQVAQLRLEKERLERRNKEMIGIMKENNIYYNAPVVND